MDWKKLLGSITESVDQELRLRNAYLAAENRILRHQSNGRVQLSDSDPAPERKKTTTWREFIHIHWDILMATDFFAAAV